MSMTPSLLYKPKNNEPTKLKGVSFYLEIKDDINDVEHVHDEPVVPVRRHLHLPAVQDQQQQQKSIGYCIVLYNLFIIKTEQDTKIISQYVRK